MIEFDYTESEISKFNEEIKEDYDEFNPYWQKNWGFSCKKKCCFSTECGGIYCGICDVVMAKNNPLSYELPNRYHCVECFKGITEPTFEFCEKCYFNLNVFHPHNKFIKVSVSDGKHEDLIRGEATNEAKELYFNEPDITTLNSKNIEEESCIVCYADRGDIIEGDDMIIIYSFGCHHAICGTCLKVEIEMKKSKNRATFKLSDYIQSCPQCMLSKK